MSAGRQLPLGLHDWWMAHPGRSAFDHHSPYVVMWSAVANLFRADDPPGSPRVFSRAEIARAQVELRDFQPRTYADRCLGRTGRPDRRTFAEFLRASNGEPCLDPLWSEAVEAIEYQSTPKHASVLASGLRDGVTADDVRASLLRAAGAARRAA